MLTPVRFSNNFVQCVYSHSYKAIQKTIDLSVCNRLTAKDSRLAFYELNYEPIALHIQNTKGKKVILGSRNNRSCRFCGKTEASGQATFRLKAHGFPALVGNRTFFTNYECDTCNKIFGDGIENQLGIYLKPYRTLAAIRGYKKFPEIKNEQEGWRIWRDGNGLHIEHRADKRIAELGADGNTLSVSIPRDPYRPIDVYRAFVKMALSLMPGYEIDNFKDELTWIGNESTIKLIPPTISTTFVESHPVNVMSAMLFKRKYDGRELPYCMALFLIGNTQFQLMVPCIGKDEHLRNKHMSFPSYPMPPELRGEQHRVHFEEVDLSETRTMINETVKYEFAFEDRIEINPSSRNVT